MGDLTRTCYEAPRCLDDLVSGLLWEKGIPAVSMHGGSSLMFVRKENWANLNSDLLQLSHIQPHSLSLLTKRRAPAVSQKLRRGAH